MVKKEFLTMNINDVKPYPNNPRVNDEAVADVIASIEQCENLAPIEIDENNIILSGHTRLKALKKLNYSEVEVIRYTGLSEKQKKKYRLLANKTGEKALWDDDKLKLELDDLDFEGFDFGFNIASEDFDEFDLDDESTKQNVVVSINCGNVANYESIKERLQNLCDEINGSLAVKMK